MRLEDLLTDEFLKQFKSRETLNDFLGQLQKRGIEKMLEGELDGHLGYDKHEQSPNSNSRNGYGKKRVKTSYGESEIRSPAPGREFQSDDCSQAGKYGRWGRRGDCIAICQGNECCRYRRSDQGCLQF
uniref:transposase n=1 Tax=Dyadobacter chenwenxiniae TaxID=2906456 RepID=UPI0021121D73|nr:transposase [Dyadobacter chenwenxiniae]